MIFSNERGSVIDNQLEFKAWIVREISKEEIEEAKKRLPKSKLWGGVKKHGIRIGF